MTNLQDLVVAVTPLLEATVGDLTQTYHGVSTDTRTVVPGNAFVALSGERFDGHEFVAAAVEKGAVCVIVEHPVDVEVAQIVVSDTGRAYGLIAKAWRHRFALPLAVVAGSNGKTTTTQMLAKILKARWDESRVCATRGNFNNEVGVPRMLLSLDFEHRAAVFECGMNHPGEMARLADWTRPTVVLLTNAQREHQEFLNGVEETARENGLVIASLPETGCAVYPADDACAHIWADLAMARGVSTLTYTTQEGVDADVVGQMEGDLLVLTTPEGEIRVPLAIKGSHNIHNATGAAAAALAMKVDPKAIVDGLSAFRALTGRGERHIYAGGILIDDAYNANPDSVRASMTQLATESGPRTYVLGDMGEVGHEVEEAHREVGAFAKSIGLDALYASGPWSRYAVEAFGENGHWFETRDALIDALKTVEGTITVKASHYMGFEQIVAALKKEE